MFWLLIAAVLLLFVSWILLAPFELEIDTRVPYACFTWQSIGTAAVVYEDERWLFSLRTLLYQHKWPLSRVFRKTGKRKTEKIRKQGKSNFKMPLQRILKIISSFRVKEWQLALDANDSLPFAMAYPLNFLPYLGQHLRINFESVSYFRIRISNRAWRMVYAWFK